MSRPGPAALGLVAFFVATAAAAPIERGPADAVVESLAGPERDLVVEVLERNPDVARMEAASLAAEEKAPQARALPDPMVGATAFALPPETRVGEQRLMLSLSQKLPWKGKRALREKAATLEAEAMRQELQALRLRLVTEVRKLSYELSFLDVLERVLEEDLRTLEHFEELARARYASGIGLDQAVVKIQAEITKIETRLLDVETKRIALTARVNELRERPSSTPVEAPVLPASVVPSVDELSAKALAHGMRPELLGTAARISKAGVGVALAEKERRPDVTVGLSYGLVTGRNDAMGAANPPEDDGQDVIGLTAGINLPIWGKKLDAQLEEALQRQSEAQDAQRGWEARIESMVGDLAAELPLIAERVRLLDQVLVVQAEQALSSAEGAYAAGTVSALDLLDAERVLLDVRIATARAEADAAIVRVNLEGAMGASLTTLDTTGGMP